MNIEPLASVQEVLPLLAECGLPVSDITPSASISFFGVRSGGALVGVVGLEIHPPFGLLRSLAVAPAFRSSGIAHKLVAFVESLAAAHGIKELFLLTTTAEGFFLGLGYSPAARTAAPPAIQATPQFSNLCPSSSAFLSKNVGAAS
ncbi:MAG: arsenic resistance N-acetyltransferase ArsN2 [Betaproteobacteria bacterium]|jgi:amino-acid N-acetyltransferase